MSLCHTFEGEELHTGLIPDKPYIQDSILTVRITPTLRRDLRKLAAERDASVSAVVKAALTHYLEHGQGIAY
ncbi:ribbon-helix-helix protein, CopG family [Burkholderia ambifaria]|uniref:ribbon-helix-helix protein, CopG family n=1 Tax=Burkholderia ambifaria TaxID=152480 RepID=UPI00312CBAC0